MFLNELELDSPAESIGPGMLSISCGIVDEDGVRPDDPVELVARGQGGWTACPLPPFDLAFEALEVSLHPSPDPNSASSDSERPEELLELRVSQVLVCSK